MEKHYWLDDSGTEHAGELLAGHADGSVVDCTSCGFAHVVPLPSEEALSEFYTKEFYQHEKADYLKSAYKDIDWRKLEFLDIFKNLRDEFNLNSGRALDIGSGPGIFLHAAKDVGWQAKGVEPSPLAAQACTDQDLDVTEGMFDAELAAKLSEFDLVHMRQVLEHLRDPQELLSLVGPILKPGGFLVLSVPNDFNAFQKTVADQTGHAPWWVVPTHHLNYFSFESLTALLDRFGFDVVLKSSTFPMELFLMLGDDYIADKSLGRSLHEKRMKLDHMLNADPALNLRQRFYGALAEAGLGRHVILYARRRA